MPTKQCWGCSSHGQAFQTCLCKHEQVGAVRNGQQSITCGVAADACVAQALKAGMDALTGAEHPTGGC